jgi:hypothetical protein
MREEWSGIDLYWLPLGAGGHSVRVNGKVYERLVAAVERRERKDLYHSALVARVAGEEFAIEMTPVPDERGEARGVVGEGPVGSRHLRRFRLFRYENRCWPGGVIPDVDEAVDSPIRVTHDPALAGAALELLPEAPTLVWGRDELGAGEMWNSNSLISWVLVRSGIGVERARLPEGGRAPGWHAGLVAAQRASRSHRAGAAPPLV